MKRIVLQGIVGWDITARLVASLLRSAKGEDVTFQVYSPGGSVFEGIQIYNVIQDYEGSVTSEIGSLAGSAASFFPLAADKVVGRPNSSMFIHESLMAHGGNADEMRTTADILDGLNNVIAGMYEKKTGKNKKEILADMKKETWLIGGEAMLNYGLIDEIVDGDDKEASTEVSPEEVQTMQEEVEAARNTILNDDQFQNEIDLASKYLSSMDSAGGFLKKILNSMAPKKGESDKHISITLNNKENSMDLQTFLAQNPSAKVEYDADITAANTAGANGVDTKAIVTQAVAEDRKRSNGIMSHAGVVISENVQTALADGQSHGDFAIAMHAEGAPPIPAPVANGSIILQVQGEKTPEEIAASASAEKAIEAAAEANVAALEAKHK